MTIFIDEDTTIVMMPTMIKVPQTPLRYGFPRSTTSEYRRWEQNMAGIKSIKSAMGDVKCVFILIETSPMDNELRQKLREQVDLLLDFHEDKDIVKCTNSDCKSLGETFTILTFLNWLKSNYPDKKFNKIIKYGSRYITTDDFNPERYNNDNKFVFHRKSHLPARNPVSEHSVHTCVYSVPYKHFELYRSHMEKCCGFFRDGSFFDIENCMTYGLEDFSEIIDSGVGICANVPYDDNMQVVI